MSPSIAFSASRACFAGNERQQWYKINKIFDIVKKAASTIETIEWVINYESEWVAIPEEKLASARSSPLEIKLVNIGPVTKLPNPQRIVLQR